MECAINVVLSLFFWSRFRWAHFKRKGNPSLKKNGSIDEEQLNPDIKVGSFKVIEYIGFQAKIPNVDVDGTKPLVDLVLKF